MSVVPAMEVIEQGCWLVDQSVSTHDHTKEHVKIFTSAGPGPRPKSRVKTTFTTEKSCGKGRTRPSAKPSTMIGVQMPLRTMFFQIKDTSNKSPGKATIRFEQELGRSFKFQR